jgi:hypothetical protein
VAASAFDNVRLEGRLHNTRTRRGPTRHITALGEGYRFPSFSSLRASGNRISPACELNNNSHGHPPLTRRWRPAPSQTDCCTSQNAAAHTARRVSPHTYSLLTRPSASCTSTLRSHLHPVACTQHSRHSPAKHCVCCSAVPKLFSCSGGLFPLWVMLFVRRLDDSLLARSTTVCVPPTQRCERTNGR